MLELVASDPLPDPKTREIGGSVNLGIAPLSYGLTKASTSGWGNPGSPDPATVDFDNPTEITTRMLGTPNVQVGARIGQQGATLKVDLQDFTPLGRQLMNKTNIVPVDTIATTAFTSAVITVGVQLANQVSLDGTSVPAIGDWLRFDLSSGLSARKDYAYVASAEQIAVNNVRVTLETDLDELPLAGATVARIINQQLYEASGSLLQKYSAKWNISGDDGSNITTFSHSGYATTGKKVVGDGKANQKYSIEFTCLARKLTVGGRYQPVHWDTDFKPPNRT